MIQIIVSSRSAAVLKHCHSVSVLLDHIRQDQKNHTDDHKRGPKLQHLKVIADHQRRQDSENFSLIPADNTFSLLLIQILIIGGGIRPALRLGLIRIQIHVVHISLNRPGKFLGHLLIAEDIVNLHPKGSVLLTCKALLRIIKFLKCMKAITLEQGILPDHSVNFTDTLLGRVRFHPLIFSRGYKISVFMGNRGSNIRRLMVTALIYGYVRPYKKEKIQDSKRQQTQTFFPAPDFSHFFQ